MALLSPSIVLWSSGSTSALQLGHRSARQSHSSHQSVPQGQVSEPWHRCGHHSAARVGASGRFRDRSGPAPRSVRLPRPVLSRSGTAVATRVAGVACARLRDSGGVTACGFRLLRGLGRVVDEVLALHLLGGEVVADLFREGSAQCSGLRAFLELADRTARPHVVRHVRVCPFGVGLEPVDLRADEGALFAVQLAGDRDPAPLGEFERRVSFLALCLAAAGSTGERRSRWSDRTPVRSSRRIARCGMPWCAARRCPATPSRSSCRRRSTTSARCAPAV